MAQVMALNSELESFQARHVNDDKKAKRMYVLLQPGSVTLLSIDTGVFHETCCF